MHEIITLQLGQRANYLATHFWNTQESYFTYSSDEESIVDHDIHFRPGIGADGTETFTPRTVIYDLKGGFGSLRKINALYEIDEPAVPQGLWSGPTIIQRLPLVEPNPYQQSLESGTEPPELTTSSVKYWSDFNRVYFHPKSIIQLNEYELSSSLMPFESWEVGDNLFSTLDKEHDLLDRDLRPFAEEADHMQGMRIMAGVDDAWGGFVGRYLERIGDEYGKTCVEVWGLEDGLSSIPREKRFMRLSNTARSIAEISAQASLYIPMTLPALTLPPYVTLDRSSKWHTSALFSTALESMTLPSRLKPSGSRETMDQLVNSLNINGNQNIAKLRMSISQPALTNGHSHPESEPSFEDSRLPSQERRGFYRESAQAVERKDAEPEVFDIDFFPTETGEQVARSNRRSPKAGHVFGQAESIRSANEGGKAEESRDGEDAGFSRARRRAAGLAIVERKSTPLPFPLLSSFPCIFASTDSLDVSTSLCTDTSISSRIKDLRRIVGMGRGVGVDEREALGNALGVVAEGYEEGWSSGSDSDDD